MANFQKELKIYKPNKNNNGSALQLSFSKEKEAVFFTITNQLNQQNKDGNAVFDWQNKGIFKLGLIDIGEILSVLSGTKDGVGLIKDGKYRGLFHSNDDGNSVLYFAKGTNSGFFVSLNTNKGDTKNTFKCSVSDAEAQILSIVLKNAVRSIFDWK